MTRAASTEHLSLQQKIGQLLIVGFKGSELKPNDSILHAIAAQAIGGVILFDYDYATKTYEHNIKSPKQLKTMNQQLQRVAHSAAIAHANDAYPLLISVDYEGGRVNRLKASYGFPATDAAAEIGELPISKAREQAQRMAQTLAAVGINMNYAPVLDVNVNPDNPIVARLQRSFSSDPQRVAQYAQLFAQALQQHHIVYAYKHFPGHGSSTGDTHQGFVDVSDTWQSKELIPYQQLLAHATPYAMVMTSHVVHKGLDQGGLPASLSKAMTTDLLRTKLHYQGIVITDDLQMKAITAHYSTREAVSLALNAGADMLVFGNQLVSVQQSPEALIAMIAEEVHAGKIPLQRIDEAYARVMKLKAQLRASEAHRAVEYAG